MKTVRKLKDFSIESILQDRFMLLGDDRYKNQHRSATSIESCEVHFPLGDKCEKCLESGVRVGVESECEDTRNGLKFEKKSPASYANMDFQVRIDDTCRVTNLDRNKDEVRANAEESKPSSRRQRHRNIVNRCENNISHTYKNSTDALTMRERKNKTRHKKCVSPFAEQKFNSTEIVAKKDEGFSRNTETYKCREISVNHKNASQRSDKNTTEYRKNVSSLEEDKNDCLRKEQRKQLEVGDEFCNRQMSGINSDYSEQRDDEDLNSESQRKLERRETSCSLNENQKKEPVKSCKDKPISLQVILNTTNLEWLKCTRYRPPKVPRKSVIGKNRRKPSIHPRIPFTTFQLDFLEQKFRNRAYLSKDDVFDISNVLHLPPNRVKIWFQNRRAKERREFSRDIQ